ncbi:hypothetical protein JHW41_10005 [Lysobacter enzymogenes]|nr:hypothetical protein JHW41_10005 [Lysobacter enzymogenes]
MQAESQQPAEPAAAPSAVAQGAAETALEAETAADRDAGQAPAAETVASPQGDAAESDDSSDAPTAHITPEQALENTRRLLQAKQDAAREPQPWQQLDPGHGHVPAPGPQSESAAHKAGELHAAESRMDAIQGSIGTQDRHNQGKRDNR